MHPKRCSVLLRRWLGLAACVPMIAAVFFSCTVTATATDPVSTLPTTASRALPELTPQIEPSAHARLLTAEQVAGGGDSTWVPLTSSPQTTTFLRSHGRLERSTCSMR